MQVGPVDWELLQRVNSEGLARERAYRCPLVEAIREARSDPFGSGDAPEMIRECLAILAEPMDLEDMVDEKTRGVAYAWCYHDDKMGYHRANTLSGGFEAR